jgi:hypothetical protein
MTNNETFGFRDAINQDEETSASKAEEPLDIESVHRHENDHRGPQKNSSDKNGDVKVYYNILVDVTPSMQFSRQTRDVRRIQLLSGEEILKLVVQGL